MGEGWDKNAIQLIGRMRLRMGQRDWGGRGMGWKLELLNVPSACRLCGRWERQLEKKDVEIEAPSLNAAATFFRFLAV
jgi:hypothetical protein